MAKKDKKTRGPPEAFPGREVRDYSKGARKTRSYYGTIREFKIVDKDYPIQRILNVYAITTRVYDTPKDELVDVHKKPLREGAKKSWKEKTAWWKAEQGKTPYPTLPEEGGVASQKALKKRKKGGLRLLTIIPRVL